eukprot:TRINITY_DN9194_c0_g1_i1.p1 TRINITY_DN9194_c0_g1~~TRINITY_DN9194_c0_g1_i1.p1  ORF type:complete len:220 (+),score=45.57 TRINITY_DN9194_c0_g1_i1:86-661(+)
MSVEDLVIGEGLTAVTRLTAQNISQAIKNGKWFIHFYAPWSSLCKYTTLQLEVFASKHQEQINVARIDASQQSDKFIKRWNIKHVPTLYLIADNQLYNFGDTNLERTEENFISFCESPSVSPGMVPEDNLTEEIKDHLEKMVVDLIWLSKNPLIAWTIFLLWFFIGAIFSPVLLWSPQKPKPSPATPPPTQ